MQLLYCDETNFERRLEQAFFVYGGIMFDASVAHDLHTAIEQARCDKNVAADAHVKFSVRPNDLDYASHKELKETMLDAARLQGCELLIYLTYHDVAPDLDIARLYGLNTIAGHFNMILRERDDYGLLFVDQFDHTRLDPHLKEKFGIGLRVPNQKPIRLSCILGYHKTAIGCSHFASLIDVAIGSFRYAIDQLTREGHENLPAAHDLLHLLSPLFPRNHNGVILEKHLAFRPRTRLTVDYFPRYVALKDALAEHGLRTAQVIPRPRA